MKVSRNIIIFLCCIINVHGRYINRDKSESLELSRSKREADAEPITIKFIREDSDQLRERRNTGEHEQVIEINLYMGTEPEHHQRRHHHDQEHRRPCHRNRMTANGRRSHCRRMHIFNRIN